MSGLQTNILASSSQQSWTDSAKNFLGATETPERLPSKGIKNTRKWVVPSFTHSLILSRSLSLFPSSLSRYEQSSAAIELLFTPLQTFVEWWQWSRRRSIVVEWGWRSSDITFYYPIHKSKSIVVEWGRQSSDITFYCPQQYSEILLQDHVRRWKGTGFLPYPHHKHAFILSMPRPTDSCKRFDEFCFVHNYSFCRSVVDETCRFTVIEEERVRAGSKLQVQPAGFKAGQFVFENLFLPSSLFHFP